MLGILSIPTPGAGKGLMGRIFFGGYERGGPVVSYTGGCAPGYSTFGIPHCVSRCWPRRNGLMPLAGGSFSFGS